MIGHIQGGVIRCPKSTVLIRSEGDGLDVVLIIVLIQIVERRGGADFNGLASGRIKEFQTEFSSIAIPVTVDGDLCATIPRQVDEHIFIARPNQNHASPDRGPILKEGDIAVNGRITGLGAATEIGLADKVVDVENERCGLCSTFAVIVPHQRIIASAPIDAVVAAPCHHGIRILSARQPIIRVTTEEQFEQPLPISIGVDRTIPLSPEVQQVVQQAVVFLSLYSKELGVALLLGRFFLFFFFLRLEPLVPRCKIIDIKHLIQSRQSLAFLVLRGCG